MFEEKERLNKKQRRWLKRHGDLTGYKSHADKHDKRLTVKKLIRDGKRKEPQTLYERQSAPGS